MESPWCVRWECSFIPICRSVLDIKNITNTCKRSNISDVSTFLVVIIKPWVATWFYSLLLLLSGDFKLNPGPKRNYSNAFFIFHWNLNSIYARNYAKVFPLQAYIAIHKFDIICISETYLIVVLLLMIAIWKFLVTS